MQTNSKGHMQVFLTFVGLGLLIFVIVFSHFRPRNQGVAAMGQNAVRTLIQNFTDKNQTTDSFNYVGLLPEAVTSTPAPTNDQDKPASQPNSNQPSQAPSVSPGEPASSRPGSSEAVVQTGSPATADSANLANLGVKPAPAHLDANLPDLKPLAPQPDSLSS